MNKIVISSNLGSADFGNSGSYDVFTDSANFEREIFEVPIPQTFNAIKIAGVAEGSLSWGVRYESGSGRSSRYSAFLEGTLDLSAKAIAGWDLLATLEAWAKGTLVNASGTSYFTSGSVDKGSLSISLGGLSIGISGSALNDYISADFLEYEIYGGWKAV